MRRAFFMPACRTRLPFRFRPTSSVAWGTRPGCDDLVSSVAIRPAKPATGPWFWLAALLLFATAISTAVIWALHAPRFFNFSEASYRDFWNRRGLMLLHAIGGTMILFAGPFLLWSGFRLWKPKIHRWVGRIYLLFGCVGAGAGGVLSLIAAGNPKGLYVSTFTLALAWFGTAAMALRAIRNRRIDAHRDWVIRNYVLTWSFVGCRLASRVPFIVNLGDEAITATVWLAWVAPLMITEVFLQWNRSSPALRRESA